MKLNIALAVLMGIAAGFAGGTVAGKYVAEAKVATVISAPPAERPESGTYLLQIAYLGVAQIAEDNDCNTVAEYAQRMAKIAEAHPFQPAP